MKKKFVMMLLAMALTVGATTGCASYEKQAEVVEAASKAAEEDAEDAKQDNSDEDDADAKDKKSAKKAQKDTDADAEEDADDAAEDAAEEVEEAAEAKTADLTVIEDEEKVAPAEDATIVVTGSSSVSAVPDRAEISLRVETQDEDAKEAQKKNSETVAAVMEALDGLNIKSSHIKTTGYDMYTRYNYDDNSITGYEVTTTIRVSGQKVTKIGEIIETSVEAGANGIDGITYTSSEYDDLYDAALDEAVKQAKHKAGVIANASGAELGAVINVSEGYQDDSSRYQDMSSFAKAETASAADTAVLPGEVDIKAQVTVTYELK